MCLFFILILFVSLLVQVFARVLLLEYVALVPVDEEDAISSNEISSGR